jgi:hypothetical protein
MTCNQTFPCFDLISSIVVKGIGVNSSNEITGNVQASSELRLFIEVQELREPLDENDVHVWATSIRENYRYTG